MGAVGTQINWRWLIRTDETFGEFIKDRECDAYQAGYKRGILLTAGIVFVLALVSEWL